MNGSALRVAIDEQAFLLHSRSGISRYFTELISAFRQDDALGVEAVTPYRFVANEHLADLDPARYRRVRMGPLRRFRPTALRTANASARRRADRSVDLKHHTLYDARYLNDSYTGPRVITVYDMIPELFPDLFPDWTDQAAAKRGFVSACDGIICISETTRQDMVTLYGASAAKVAVIPLAASRSFAEPPVAVTGLPSRYVLYVGTRSWHKNVSTLLAAFTRVARRAPDLHLVLVGGGALTAAESALLGGAGVLDRVVQTEVDDARLPGVYAAAQLLVHPSQYEGFGLPVVEAFAAGCPTLLADTPCLREVAGSATRYFAPMDVDALETALEQLLGDVDARHALAEQGHLESTRYSWAETARRTAQFYADVVSR